MLSKGAYGKFYTHLFIYVYHPVSLQNNDIYNNPLCLD